MVAGRHELQTVWYEIDPTRSGEVIRRLLGADWVGQLVHDGWSPYDSLSRAIHQQCNAHLLRRCDELLETAVGGAVRFPRAVKELFLTGLQLRDRYEQGELTEHGLLVMEGRLKSQLLDLVLPSRTHAGNERFGWFLYNHLDEIFAYLRHPGMDATNWRGEQAIRPAVVNRKVWGGNRTWAGAKAQSILTSLIQTCRLRLSAFVEITSYSTPITFCRNVQRSNAAKLPRCDGTTVCMESHQTLS